MVLLLCAWAGVQPAPLPQSGLLGDPLGRHSGRPPSDGSIPRRSWRQTSAGTYGKRAQAVVRRLLDEYAANCSRPMTPDHQRRWPPLYHHTGTREGHGSRWYGIISSLYVALATGRRLQVEWTTHQHMKGGDFPGQPVVQGVRRRLMPSFAHLYETAGRSPVLSMPLGPGPTSSPIPLPFLPPNPVPQWYLGPWLPLNPPPKN